LHNKIDKLEAARQPHLSITTIIMTVIWSQQRNLTQICMAEALVQWTQL